MPKCVQALSRLRLLVRAQNMNGEPAVNNKRLGKWKQARLPPYLSVPLTRPHPHSPAPSGPSLSLVMSGESPSFPRLGLRPFLAPTSDIICCRRKEASARARAFILPAAEQLQAFPSQAGSVATPDRSLCRCHALPH